MMPNPGRTNFFYLLIALLVVLIVVPLADDLGLIGAPLIRGLVFSGLLIIGVWSLRGGGRHFNTKWAERGQERRRACELALGCVEGARVTEHFDTPALPGSTGYDG